MTKKNKGKTLTDAQLDAFLDTYDVPPHSDDMQRRILEVTQTQTSTRPQVFMFWRRPAFVFAVVVLIMAVAVLMPVFQPESPSQQDRSVVIAANTQTPDEVEAFLEQTIDQDIAALEYAMVVETDPISNQQNSDEEIEEFLDEVFGVDIGTL